VCKEEYTNGRIQKREKHTAACIRFRRQQREEAARADHEALREKESIKRKRQKTTNSSTLKRPKAQQKESDPTCQSQQICIDELSRTSQSIDGGIESDSSTYNIGIHRPLQTLRVANRKDDKANATGSAPIKKSTEKTNNKHAKESSRSTARSSREGEDNADVVEKQGSRIGEKRTTSVLVKCLHGKRIKASLESNKPASNEESSDDGSDGELEMTWEDCQTPWGVSGYQEGDVIVFSGPACGLGHYETVLPSQRFEQSPFASSKRYWKTHRTPQEG